MIASTEPSRFNGLPVGRRRKVPDNPLAAAVRQIGTGDVADVALLLGVSKAALHGYMNAGKFKARTATARGTQYWTVRRLAYFSGTPEWILLGFAGEQEMFEVEQDLAKRLGIERRRT
jgi:hypothetical protein